jgi:large subunit ribosomal protein L25
MATLKARLRKETGKGVARKLRGAGEIPAVSYGHGQEGRSLVVNAHELELLLAGINPETTIIDLLVDEARPVPVLIREVQRHPSRPVILHVDFFQVRAGEKLHVSVPVRLHGTPVGVTDSSGVLQEVLRELSVECLPRNIPSGIDVDISHLQLGDSILVSDIEIEQATILNPGDLVICTVTTLSVASLPEDAVTEEGVGGEVEPELVRDRREEAEGTAAERGSAQPE